MPTKQETFDTVVAHLRKQGQKSLYNGRCRYRTPDGLKCAVGCLIPDSEYDEGLEGGYRMTGAHNLIVSLGHDADFAEELQIAHDNIEINKWEESFRGIASDFGLTYTPPAE